MVRVEHRSVKSVRHGLASRQRMGRHRESDAGSTVAPIFAQMDSAQQGNLLTTNVLDAMTCLKTTSWKSVKRLEQKRMLHNVSHYLKQTNKQHQKNILLKNI